ncbi:HEAT repeat domain-containing protein, partial [Haliangium sp.]|uniref:HEAT repeat domain-containing protein n=1 Tax=Haliangium sp. TaxID=2663208 RepID=UPI003D13C4D5
RRCHSGGPVTDALDRALAGDPATPVRRAALTALVTCRAPGIGARLMAIAQAQDQPEPIRRRALTLIPTLADPALSAPLLALFQRLRGQAWSDARALRLAATAAVVLGRLGDPAAVAALLEAARDPAFAELQAAALTALGEMCPAQAGPVFDRALQSTQRAVIIAARSARRRCGP